MVVLVALGPRERLHHLVVDQHGGVDERGVHPQQGVVIVRAVAVTGFEAPHVLGDRSVDGVVDGPHAVGRLERVRLRAEDHVVDVQEGAVEAPDRIGARLAVLVHAVGHIGVRQLE